MRPGTAQRGAYPTRIKVTGYRGREIKTCCVTLNRDGDLLKNNKHNPTSKGQNWLHLSFTSMHATWPMIYFYKHITLISLYN
jgi:hypothetical protein